MFFFFFFFEFFIFFLYFFVINMVMFVIFLEFVWLSLVLVGVFFLYLYGIDSEMDKFVMCIMMMLCVSIIILKSGGGLGNFYGYCWLVLLNLLIWVISLLI